MKSTPAAIRLAAAVFASAAITWSLLSDGLCAGTIPRPPTPQLAQGTCRRRSRSRSDAHSASGCAGACRIIGRPCRPGRPRGRPREATIDEQRRMSGQRPPPGQAADPMAASATGGRRGGRAVRRAPRCRFCARPPAASRSSASACRAASGRPRCSRRSAVARRSPAHRQGPSAPRPRGCRRGISAAASSRRSSLGEPSRLSLRRRRRPHGRFKAADRDRLAALARRAAAALGAALENARLFDETQRLLKETEQRNAELAVINGIQHGSRAALDFQAIVDLVGDKLREVFATGDLCICWCDEATEHGCSSTSTSTASGCTSLTPIKPERP